MMWKAYAMLRRGRSTGGGLSPVIIPTTIFAKILPYCSLSCGIGKKKLADLDFNNFIMADEIFTDRKDDGQPVAEMQTAASTTFGKFSRHNDMQGYNCWVITKHAVDCIVEATFAQRKELIVAKMQGLPGEVLKFDFSYKLAPKSEYILPMASPFLLTSVQSLFKMKTCRLFSGKL
jgi:hypothetical protein